MTTKKLTTDLKARLLQIRGTQFTPIENALVTEAAAHIEALEKQVEVYREVLAPVLEGAESKMDIGRGRYSVLFSLSKEWANKARALLNSTNGGSDE